MPLRRGSKLIRAHQNEGMMPRLHITFVGKSSSSGTAFDVEFGTRLGRVYSLNRAPKDVLDFFELLKEQRLTQPETVKFFEFVRSGKGVIGETVDLTKDWIIVGGERKVHTRCSLDSLLTGLLQLDSTVGSSCPHCGEAIRVRIEGGELKGFEPKTAVFLCGAGPDGAPGDPMCDHLHLFPDSEHMNAWVRSKEGEMGFSLELPEAIEQMRAMSRILPSDSLRSRSQPPWSRPPGYAFAHDFHRWVRGRNSSGRFDFWATRRLQDLRFDSRRARTWVELVRVAKGSKV